LLDIIPRTNYLESGELVTEGQRSRNLTEFIAFNDRGLPGQENRSDSCGSDKSPRDGIIWIVKPAAKTDRSFGIQVVRGLEEVLNIVNRSANGNKSKADSSDINTECKLSKEDAKVSRLARLTGAREGWIVQLYLNKPMQVTGRKFDVRCFVLVTHFKCQGLRSYFCNGVTSGLVQKNIRWYPFLIGKHILLTMPYKREAKPTGYTKKVTNSVFVTGKKP
jgi:Tubulin-tyrosine ligase family